MDHHGHLQAGGVESGQPWNTAVARVDDTSISFWVNGSEVGNFSRQDLILTREEDLWRVVTPEETLFFKPSNATMLDLDLKDEKSSADRIALASAQTAPQGQIPGAKSKVAAGVLGILLGGFGAHKFYLGEAGMGILYLVFFWTAIPALIGLIEGIIYLTMSDADFARKYG